VASEAIVSKLTHKLAEAKGGRQLGNMVRPPRFEPGTLGSEVDSAGDLTHDVRSVGSGRSGQASRARPVQLLA
jgi:hypothetical protein